MIHLRKKWILLGILGLSACQIGVGTGASPTPQPSTQPTVSQTPLPESSMPPWDPSLAEATAAPPSAYFLKVEPTTVCLGDTLSFSAHLQKAGAKSLFLEKDLNREGKVPYFAGPYVLVQRFDTQENANIQYDFTLTDPMPDAESAKTLAIPSGKYLLHLVHEDGEITGVDYITVTECQGS